ncbi:YbjQ family protein [Olleya sp. HaHaR_3_96]|uniref:YbjQ family protein n=1 Tax=Olleya sp. HaHaR_3_96 TaxID=2745560 RepID=UPI001C4E60E5|nr:heavy metal-binding domain-containing protein [Olleya sp. HaHaR_3_96]QXP60623.1 heavy metal-binding domain-containing protein [Olleya sp. HaHaR_3_96]
MILTTTNSIEGFRIVEYKGIVTGVSVNTRKASFSFKMDKYYASVEATMNDAKEDAFQKLTENAKKLNANAVVGIKLDLETNPNLAMTMVSVTGTAVNVATDK